MCENVVEESKLLIGFPARPRSEYGSTVDYNRIALPPVISISARRDTPRAPPSDQMTNRIHQNSDPDWGHTRASVCSVETAGDFHRRADTVGRDIKRVPAPRRADPFRQQGAGDFQAKANDGGP